MSGKVLQGPWRSRITRVPGSPPTTAYLAERERLGMPSPGPVLVSSCPWCQAAPFEPCRNRAISRTARRPHDARRP